jgi:predicted protein tyrosine phosphatase
MLSLCPLLVSLSPVGEIRPLSACCYCDAWSTVRMGWGVVRDGSNDTALADIAQYFDSAYDFISTAVRSGHGVLIHCARGVSRSVAVALAYLIREHGLPLADAYVRVRSVRPQAKPNANFLRQLVAYEKRVRAERAASTNASGAASSAPTAVSTAGAAPAASSGVPSTAVLTPASSSTHSSVSPSVSHPPVGHSHAAVDTSSSTPGTDSSSGSSSSQESSSSPPSASPLHPLSSSCMPDPALASAPTRKRPLSPISLRGDGSEAAHEERSAEHQHAAIVVAAAATDTAAANAPHSPVPATSTVAAATPTVAVLSPSADTSQGVKRPRL